METLLQFDESLYKLINSGLSSNVLDLILVPFRHKLFWIPLYLFLLSYILLNFRRQRWLVILGIILCMTLSDTLSSKIIKKSVKRTRPCHIEKLDPIKRVPCSHGFSFTSSHATNHFALGGFFFFLFAFTNLRVLFLIWAGVIGFAQIYVGVHYPLDVFVGSLLGFLIGFSTFTIYQKANQIYFKNTNNTV